MARPRKEQVPAPDMPQFPGPDPVREQVKNMTGFNNEEEMASSLPESTIQGSSPGFPTEPKQRRKRRTRAEIEAAQGAVTDPDEVLMQDVRYRTAVEHMRAAGVTRTVKGGFKAAAVSMDDPAWELDTEEIGELDDFSYVASKKWDFLDPTKSLWRMALYFVAMLGIMVFRRAGRAKTEVWLKKLTAMFGKEETPEQPAERGDERVTTP